MANGENYGILNGKLRFRRKEGKPCRPWRKRKTGKTPIPSSRKIREQHPRSPLEEKKTVQAQKTQRNSRIAHKEGKERKKSKKYFANSPKKRTFALAIRNDASKVDSLAQLVEHNTFNVGVLGSSPKRITGNQAVISKR